MRIRLATVAVAALAALALSGCLRQSSYYYIQSDDTVDGVVYTAYLEENTDDAQPYRGTNAGEIADYFTNATVSEFDNGEWIGYHIDFVDEPLSTFAAVPDAAWKVQITKTGNQYVVYGYPPSADDDGIRQLIHDQDGFLQMTVIFPGSLVESSHADETSVGAEIPGWAGWDMDEVTNQPYARGNGGFVFHLVPGWLDLFVPEGPPPLDPAPAPVVTVVITPEPDAPATPDTPKPETPTASPSKTTVIAAPGGDDEKVAIPVWVWAAGGALVLALAGLIGYTVANRKPTVPVPAAAVTPEVPTPEVPTPEVPKDEAPKK